MSTDIPDLIAGTLGVSRGTAYDMMREALAEQSAQQEPVALPCCGYTDASAVKWNPYNQVVQCHNCGQVYTTPQPPAQPLTREPLTNAQLQNRIIERLRVDAERAAQDPTKGNT